MAFQLIVEVGSTKADWGFIDSDGLRVSYTSVGYNPTYCEKPNYGFITQEIKNSLLQTDYVYYYGAGASTVNGQKAIRALFLSFDIDQLSIETDLMAAARATCGNKSGLISILGTGSNSGYYDGVNCSSTIPSLGFILGDYGSGSYIGKCLLQAFFYKQMPKKKSDLFMNLFGLNRELLVQELYSTESPARYLGKFTYFLSQIEGDWKDKFLENIFREFVDLHFYNNPHIKNCKLHLVGSVAFTFKDQLVKVCSERNIQIGEVLKSPNSKLIEYHIRKYE